MLAMLTIKVDWIKKRKNLNHFLLVNEPAPIDIMPVKGNESVRKIYRSRKITYTLKAHFNFASGVLASTRSKARTYSLKLKKPSPSRSRVLKTWSMKCCLPAPAGRSCANWLWVNIGVLVHFLIISNLLLEYFARGIEVYEPGVHSQYLRACPPGVILQPQQHIHVQRRGEAGCLVTVTLTLEYLFLYSL